MLMDGFHDRQYSLLLSNLRCQLRGLIEEAIENTDRHDLYCRDEPGGEHAALMLDTHFSLWRTDNRDCSDFWREVDRLKLLPRWKIYLALAE